MLRGIAGSLAIASLASGTLLGSLDAGPYPVGFRLILERDASRPALPPASGSGRQIPIAIWYPSARSADAGLSVRDYVIAAAQALVGVAPSNPRESLDAFMAEPLARGVGRRDLEQLLNTPTLAAGDAAPARGRFPLVLFAHASVDTESVMCEYLASHGYVVAAVRSRGTVDTAYRLSRENLDAMVADHDFAAARVRREPYVSAGAVGAIGMSNGSIAAMALQLKGVAVGAIVSLDGGIGENAGGTYLNERSHGDVSAFVAPLLHLYAPNNTHLNLEHLRSYRASARMLVLVRGMRHADFLAYPAFDRLVPRFSGSDASPDADSGFSWVNRYTRHFLDARLRGASASAEWLAATPESHGAPPGLLTIERLDPR